MHDFTAHYDVSNFDIDVDLTGLLETDAIATGNDDNEPNLISERWYRLARPSSERPAALQAKIERAFHNEVLAAQWRATCRRRLDRRRALRVPLLSRVRIDGGGVLTSTDISLSGVRCAGRPKAPLMSVELRLPGLAFPIDSRVEVTNFRDHPDFPWVGLRFINIERPYIDHIARYIDRRCRRPRAA